MQKINFIYVTLSTKFNQKTTGTVTSIMVPNFHFIIIVKCMACFVQPSVKSEKNCNATLKTAYIYLLGYAGSLELWYFYLYEKAMFFLSQNNSFTTNFVKAGNVYSKTYA